MIEKFYINGEWVEADDLTSIAIFNPSNGQVIGKVPYLGKAETTRAISAASAALPAWRGLCGKQRGQILKKFHQLIMENKQELAKVITLEQGKTLRDAEIEINYGASFVEWYGEEASRIYGEIVPAASPGQELFKYKEAVGVVAAITPWNFPSAMITRKIAPALAAGCTIVVKPSEETPFSSLMLAKLAEAAGVPAGVLNIVGGDAIAIGEELTSNREVKMLTFTGSTSVGKILMSKCAGQVKKVTLELGGNAPFIIFADCDLDSAVDGVLASKLRNGGQSCICVNRVFVHESIREEFCAKLVAKFSKNAVGDGMDPTTTIGPLINQNAVTKIRGLIADAVLAGSEILYRGDVNDSSPCFMEGVIILNKQHDLSIAKTEIFGPVISIFTFSDEQEVVRLANDTDYGLASYVYTKDCQRTVRVVRELEYGMVGVNNVAISSEVTSFGGVKQSGLGREGGKEGILEYLEDKFVAIS